jgi:diguanylate cyclase (GGDEF)-like protein
MLSNLLARFRSIAARQPITSQDACLLAAALLVAALIAYDRDLFGGGSEKTIDLEEALALAILLCVGLLAMGAHFLVVQRREVARRISAERQARRLALLDDLTSLPNRRQFDRELKSAATAPPGPDRAHAVMLLDLNGFKAVNDLHGHATGDEVLIGVATRLQQAVRQGDLVARFGGDEFAVLARHVSGAGDATNIALRIIAELGAPITAGALRHQVGVGIGIALVPQDGTAPEELLRKADVALYRAKEEGGSHLRFFEPAMDAHLRERDRLERGLRNGLETGAVRPFYQPLVDLRTNEVVGFEALARWTHSELGEVPPDRFLPVAEHCGLATELMCSLLRQACRDALAWPPHVHLAFNISPRQLKDRTLGADILAILAEVGFPPARLEIELTESAVVQDLETAQAVVGTLRQAGVRVALDDFGTGYSSLYHLRNFKIDKIKIDRSFVENMDREDEARILVRALLGLGQGLGLTVTAEGVEYPRQAEELRAQGCQQAQGFLYSRAVPAEQTAAFFPSAPRHTVIAAAQ